MDFGCLWVDRRRSTNSPGVERPVPSAHVCRCRRPDSFYKSSDVLSSDESWESHGRKIAARKRKKKEPLSLPLIHVYTYAWAKLNIIVIVKYCACHTWYASANKNEFSITKSLVSAFHRKKRAQKPAKQICFLCFLCSAKPSMAVVSSFLLFPLLSKHFKYAS